MASSSLRPILALLALAVAAWGCDNPPPPVDAGVDTGLDANLTQDGGIPCEMDSECDDGVACTRDVCDPTGVCRSSGDNAMCDDGIFCNGPELCDQRLGCMPGMRRSCDDGDVCTIDRCDEATDGCESLPRDLDEDGDVDFFCTGGNDCDDRDARRSSLASEICADTLDNDCDSTVDEALCGRPPYDICDAPLDISAGGTFFLDTRGAAPDYALGCTGPTARPDLVMTFTLTEPRDVRIESEGDFTTVLALRTTCTDRLSEMECRTGFPALVRRRALPAGTYFVVATGFGTGELAITAEFTAASPAPTNETCTSPLDVSAGGTFAGSMLDVTDDLSTTCGFSGSPDLVYTFTTTMPQNVRISATAATGESMAWEVRPTCGSTAGSLRCVYGGPAAGQVRELPAGTYFLVVEGPTFNEVDFTLQVDFLPSAPPLQGDRCADPIPLTLGVRTTGTLTDMEDDHDTTCGFRSRDVVYTFSLAARRDITVEVDGGGTFMNASVRNTTCTDSVGQLRCASGLPLRMRMRDVPAGTYWVVVEASRAASFAITVTDSAPTVPVPASGNDGCATAVTVPPTGGLFMGSTTGFVDDYQAALCPFTMANGPDAAFRLDLPVRQRVVASTDGSAFDTVLTLHPGMCLTRGESACDDDGGEGVTSLLDRVLDPGTYFFVVDGYGPGSAGNYLLELQITPPP
jgi:hypothetical protein